VTPITDRPNALDDTLLHRVLVFSDRMAMMSPAALIFTLLANAVLVGVMWWSAQHAAAGLAAASSMAAFSALCGVMLGWLPRAGRSWGAYQPPLIALTAAMTLGCALIGILGLPTAVMWGVLALTLGIAFYATWVEPFRVGVTRHTLKNQANTRTFTLLHLGDLHIEHLSPRERQVNALIERLRPDVIVFSGDFVNISYTYDAQSEAEIRSVIGAWRAPLGIFCVPGTPAVEPLERVVAFTRQLPGVTLLTNAWHSVTTQAGDLHILGLVTTHDLHQDRAALHQALQGAPNGDGLRLLLAHAPDLAPEAARAHFDLYLCGHTHGGQIRLPLIGALFSASHYGRRFAIGRHRVDDMTLYTTRGLGMEGFGAPRARFLCPPEIVLWEITP
jgi:hypothetical protein